MSDMNNEKLYIATRSGCIAGMLVSNYSWNIIGYISNKFAHLIESSCNVSNITEHEETLFYDLSKAVWEKKNDTIKDIDVIKAWIIVVSLYKKIINKI